MKKSVFIILSLLAAGLNNSLCFAELNPSDIEKIEIISPVNIRTGPNKTFPAIGQANSGEILSVIGEDNNWYLVCLKDGSYGMIYSDYAEIISLKKEPLAQGDSGEENLKLTDSEIVFSMINSSRAENGLPPFEWNEKLNNIADLKGNDMVKNNYFSHESPVYGTPFKMLKSMEVEYISASENLAFGADLEKIYEEMIQSPSHRGNILSPRFNKIGLAVCESKLGKIIVQIFVEE